ncbi:type II toxin-antitoxin system HicB family antitoxin [Nitrospira sp. MA-1]|nr:type II toxin-antitoxin system HicB family antitoxin [Nitrospira sp. MA-1]
MRYAIVIKKSPTNFASYVPDLPGCVATGATLDETETLIREAIVFHLEGIQAVDQPLPSPSCQVEYVELSV